MVSTQSGHQSFGYEAVPARCKPIVGLNLDANVDRLLSHNARYTYALSPVVHESHLDARNFLQAIMNMSADTATAARDAQNALANAGIEYNERTFLRHVGAGNLAQVRLFLAAGMSPDTIAKDKSALVIAAENAKEEVFKVLLSAGAKPRTLVDAFHRSLHRESYWTRLSEASGALTFASGLLIAAVGWHFTNSYNDRQLALATEQSKREAENKIYQNRVLELQTVEKLIPHLAKDEKSKQAALVAISVLASPDVAARLARIYEGEGAVEALKQIASGSPQQGPNPAITALTSIAEHSIDDKLAAFAKEALGSVLSGKEKALLRLGDTEASTCNAFVVDRARGWAATAAYCLRFAMDKKKDPSDLRIRTLSGKELMVTTVAFDKEDLVGLFRVENADVVELELSSVPSQPGDAIIQFAFDLTDQKHSEQRVRFGRVQSVGETEFSAFSTNKVVKSLGTRVSLAASPQIPGSGGSPLLSAEGKVACMTFQGSGDWDQCIPASTIRSALEQVRALTPQVLQNSPSPT